MKFGIVGVILRLWADIMIISFVFYCYQYSILETKWQEIFVIW